MVSLGSVAQRAMPRAASRLSQQVRGMATEKQILMQINATKNIRKITASMKMVSAAKLKGDENRLAAAKPFNSWTSTLASPPVDLENATFDDVPAKTLLVPFTSEKGLCGGVNSFISRGVKNCIKVLKSQGKECDLVVIGDKGRGQLRRTHGEYILRSATDVHAPGTFALASALTAELMAVGAHTNYDAVMLLYNSYVNPAVYKQKYKIITPIQLESMELYEVDEARAESLEEMYQYLLASQVFHSFMDGAAAEQSSRMTAMENASKNAGEMIGSLTLKYNRARQARITTELIEIISGASALDDS